MKKSLLILTLVFALLSPQVVNAAVKAGGSCKKLGQTTSHSGKKYTCIKSVNRLIWNKGVSVSKPIPIATPLPTQISTPIPTPVVTPTKPGNLNVSQEITPISELSDLSLCKTADLTTRGVGSNGFPRPSTAFIGSVNPTILFIPLNFPDTPKFSEPDLLHAQKVLKEVKEFYKDVSYGRVNIEFEILEEFKWINMAKSAEFYGLNNPRPQQNNTAALFEILGKVDASVNFDLYDAVIIETARYQGPGVGQAWFNTKFPTQNGFAKGVSLETAGAAGSFHTLAHELGHTLFGLEDLYVFLNDQRPSVPGGPNPAGSWDMMSDSSREFLGWSKFLSGWFESQQVRCLSNQSITTHYVESLEIQNQGPKIVLINLQQGVTLGIEVRQIGLTNSRGVLVYKVDSRINHGDGPIVAQRELLYEGRSLEVDGWRILAHTEGVTGMLIKVEKIAG